LSQAALAIALISLALVLLVLGAGLRQSVGLSVIAIFPAIISVACLVPQHRTLALRIVGGVMCFGTLALFVGQMMALDVDVEIGRRGRGALVAICAASGLMTFRGRWPSAESTGSRTVKKRKDTRP
jgi:hypothetical protein